MKILFQGDSITDADRNRDDYHDLGKGYPKYAAEYINEKYPDADIEFIDLGISGNQTKDLVERLESDFIDINADIISIMIGVNDVWHYSDGKNWLSNDLFEARYRKVLTAIKERTHAKLMIIEPFLIPGTEKDFFREDLDPKIQIVRRLATEFADVYLPTDGHLASAYIGNDPLDFAADGVHPTAAGAAFIGSLYCDYVSPLIDEILAK